jgi:hypothetical protein
MLDDPAPQDAKVAIFRTKEIMQEFNNNKKISQFMNEAKAAHSKMLKADNEDI